MQNLMGIKSVSSKLVQRVRFCQTSEVILPKQRPECGGKSVQHCLVPETFAVFVAGIESQVSMVLASETGQIAL